MARKALLSVHPRNPLPNQAYSWCKICLASYKPPTYETSFVSERSVMRLHLSRTGRCRVVLERGFVPRGTGKNHIVLSVKQVACTIHMSEPIGDITKVLLLFGREPGHVCTTVFYPIFFQKLLPIQIILPIYHLIVPLLTPLLH